MHRSDAHLDAPRGLVRLRFPAFTGEVRGVVFRDGEAQNGCAPHVAEALRGIFGPALAVVGPWGAAPSPPRGAGASLSAPPQSSVSPPAPSAPTIATVPPAGGVSPSAPRATAPRPKGR